MRRWGVRLFESWTSLVGDTAESRQAWSELIVAWSQSHRSYHGLRHLFAVLDIIDRYAEVAADPVAVGLAAWFHDVVYEPAAADNEQRSAALARRVLATLDLSPVVVAEVSRLVLVTVSHDVEPGDANAALLCAADLSVLAAPAPAYARYAAAIRAEYAHVGDADFRAGRAMVLRGLISRPVLFSVAELAERWDAQARANMAVELGTLQ